jgi:YHS domain-containing protein
MRGEDLSRDVAIDPVCGQTLRPEAQRMRCQYRERLYYFCSETCCQRFVEGAERFRMQELALAGALMRAQGVHLGLC